MIQKEDDEDMEYRQCPYCDKLFEIPTWTMIGLPSLFDLHIQSVHKKVKVWKGRKAQWIDKAETQRRVDTKYVGSTNEKSKASQIGKSDAKSTTSSRNRHSIKSKSNAASATPN